MKYSLKSVAGSLGCLKSLLVYTVIFQVAVGSSLLAYAVDASRTGARRGGKLSQLTSADFARPFILQRMMDDPAFEAFAKAPALPSIDYDAADPAIDSDPFFLRSQSWTSSAAANGSEGKKFSFSKDRNANLTLNFPAIKRSLELRAPLSPVYFSDEYIFLSLDEGSDLFAKAVGALPPGEKPGEGLFFISYDELLANSVHGRPVHVHFFPLPGTGWTGEIKAEEVPQIDSLKVTSREGVWLPLEFKDVEKVREVQALNSFLGSMLTLRATSAELVSGLGAEGLRDLQQLAKKPESGSDATAAVTTMQRIAAKMPVPLPARGSTMGFGMLFTGLDLEHGSRTASLLKLFQSAARELNPFSVREARAASPEVYSQLMEQMLTFGKIFGGVIAVSVLLKYTILKAKFEERRAISALRKIPSLEFNIPVVQELVKAGFLSPEALAQASENEIMDAGKVDAATAAALKAQAGETALRLKNERPGVESKLLKKVLPQGAQESIGRFNNSKFMREVVIESGSALAHSLNFLSQFTTALTANTLERLGDRYVPEIAAADNSLGRKILHPTFLFARKVSEETPVSMKTFMLGAVVMGTVDTSIVAFQDIWMIPEMCKAIAPHLPPAIEDRVYQAFSAGNEETWDLVVKDIVRNYIAWMTQGASSYSQETQAQNEAMLREQVDEAMRRTGNNPLAPENQPMRERLYKDAKNKKLRQLGLPDNLEFMFDASTLDAKVLEALGIRLNAKEREKVQADGYISDSRPGLRVSALHRALKEARLRLRNAPTDGNRRVVELLESIRQQNSLFSADLGNSTDPKEIYKSVKAAISRKRQIAASLSLLTYTGEIDAAVKYVPELWGEIDPEAAKSAAVLYRQAYFSYYTGDGTLIELPPDFVAVNVEQASRSALKELSAEYGLANDALRASHELEFALRVEQKLREKYVAETTARQVESYRHPVLGWYEKKQHQRAMRIANEKISADRAVLELSHEELDRRYRQYYGEALAEEFAVYLDREDQGSRALIERAQSESEETTRYQIERDAGLRRYLEKLESGDASLGIDNPQEEAVRIRFWLQALNFIEAYRSGAVDKNLVPPRSVAQPGFTQKVRQWSGVRENQTATLLLRLVDSFFSDEIGHRPGLKAKFDRNFPGFYDMRTSMTRNAKLFTSSVTAKYQFLTYFWQTRIPFASYAMFSAFGFLISGPSQWLNRLMRQQGWKPMDSVGSKIKYGIPYAFVTFGGSIPVYVFREDAIQAWAWVTRTMTESQAYLVMSSMATEAAPYWPALLLLPLMNELKHRFINQRAIENATREAARREAPKPAVDPVLEALRICEGAFL